MNPLRLLTAMAIASAVAAPQMALAANQVKTNSFYGDVVHTSVTNVKVYDPKTKQTLSFMLTPKFDKLFSSNGKTTYQMKDLKHGQYVRVVYDQKMLGVRHADKIFILRSNNMPAKKQIPSKIH
jgi:predicted sugar kinase